MKSITYNELDKYIQCSPTLQVIATGEHVECVTQDKDGVCCEDDNGVTVYEHSELALIDGEWKY